MQKISVGYLNLSKKTFISNLEITKNFLNPLRDYVDVKIISVGKLGEIEDSFKKIEKYKLDYLYLDVFNFLLPSFLIREKLGLDIPFILGIHTVYYWIDRYVYIIPLIREKDIIFSPATCTKESFLRISDKFDVRVIPNFLDVKFIQNNISVNLNKKKNFITFMGRLVEEKGIGTLIRCMPKIISQVENAHLNIIGPLSGERVADYPQSPYVRELKREAKRLKLTKQVHFKGARFGLDKYKMLAKSDIFVSPTTALEVFPIANIEALACGVPVIATSWPGNKELIREGKNGFLVSVNNGPDKNPKVNTGQLVSLIVNTLKDKQFMQKMRRNCLLSAQGYDYRRILPRLVSLLRKKVKLKTKSKWNLIKGKTVLDFRGIFNKDTFFFLNFDNNYRKETYASLYKKSLQESCLKKEFHPRTARKKGLKRPQDIKITGKLRQNFLQFLLFKNN